MYFIYFYDRPQEPFQKKRPPKPPMPLNLPGIPQNPKHR